jgi:hypothetical protein
MQQVDLEVESFFPLLTAAALDAVFAGGSDRIWAALYIMWRGWRHLTRPRLR